MQPRKIFILLISSLLFPFLLKAQDTTVSDSVQKQQIKAKAEYIKGLEEFENENYQNALDHLSIAYSELSDHPGINFALADAYMAVDDLSNAAFYGKKAAELAPKNKWYHLKLANIYRRAGKNQATIDELKLALKYHPNATDVMSELASVYAQHGEPLESNKIYNRLLNKTGPDIGIYLQKLQNFNEIGIRDSSIVQLKKIRRLDPDNLSTLHMLSNYYLEVDKPEQAKQMLREALDKNGRDPKTLVMLSDIYVEEAKWDSVGTLLGNMVSDPIIDKQAKLDVTQYLFSRYQQAPNNPQLKKALEQLLDQFIKSEPDYGAAHALAADYHLNENNNTKALEALAKTNELAPSNDMAWRQRMQLLLAGGKYRQVIEAGKEANQHVPQDPFVLYFIGNAYLGLGKHGESLEWFEKASQTPSRKSFKSAIYGSMGDAHSALDQWDQAVKAYEQALSLDPENHNTLNNYAYYLSERGEKLDKAEQMALKAIDQAPKNPSYLDTVGWVYYKKGNYEKARRYIKASIDTGGASAEVLEHMGDILHKLDKTEEAKEWWQKALQKDSSRTHLKEKIET